MAGLKIKNNSVLAEKTDRSLPLTPAHYYYTIEQPQNYLTTRTISVSFIVALIGPSIPNL